MGSGPDKPSSPVAAAPCHTPPPVTSLSGQEENPDAHTPKSPEGQDRPEEEHAPLQVDVCFSHLMSYITFLGLFNSTDLALGG